MVTALTIGAVLITAQPLVDEDVLEPSVQNEVDHALSRAPTNDVPVTAATQAFARLWETNGASATALAIALVSSQGSDGRWIYLGEDVTPAATSLLHRVSCADADRLHPHDAADSVSLRRVEHN